MATTIVADLCTHVDEPRVNRIRTGYLGDTPRGVVDVLCTACGAVLPDEEEAELDIDDFLGDAGDEEPYPAWLEEPGR